MEIGDLAKKPSITVSTDFYDGLLRSAGHRKIGVFIEKHLTPIVATSANLDAGYKAMADDSEREQQAQEWCCSLSGRTLRNETW